MKKYCGNCLKEVECQYKERTKILEYQNKKINFLEKYYICNECGNEFYDDLYDYNIMAGNEELRKAFEIITREEIEEIIKKYNIGKKPLSLVLGLGEITITRYLDGQNPTKENSELLKMILNNPLLFEMYLIVNKDKITEIAYKKSLGKTKQIELNEKKSKLYNVCLYIINKVKEIDALALQKLLYFTELFSKSFLNENIIEATPEAWIYGPVYSDIYNSFSYYKSNRIDYNELTKNSIIDLSQEEMQYIDSIIRAFGYYSGCILKEMTHLTDPWIEARKGLSENEPSSRIIEEKDINDYAKRIINDYNIKELKDIEKYSKDLFKKAIKSIEL